MRWRGKWPRRRRTNSNVGKALIKLCLEARPRAKGDWSEVQLETESQCGWAPEDSGTEGDDEIIEDPLMPVQITHEPGTDPYQEALARVAPEDAWLEKIQEFAQKSKGNPFTKRLASVLRCAVQSGIGSLNRNEPNREILRALIWCVAACPTAEIIDALRQLAIWSTEHNTAQAKTIGIALAYTNSEHAAAALRMAQLSAKGEGPRSRFGRYASHVERKMGIDPEASAERFVPDFGLDLAGTREASFGDSGTVRLQIEGSKAAIRYFNPSGQEMAGASSAMKRSHAAELKELRAIAKGLNQVLSNQRNRIEAMFIRQPEWDYSKWRACYLDHPLVASLAKRLIWELDGSPVLFTEKGPITVTGKVALLPKSAKVTLWHPLDRSVKEVLAWRSRLETVGLTQPFKQAHREVYLLTEAERRTATYSNRFAGHILRQRQFRVLAQGRGWKAPLLGAWCSGDQGVAERSIGTDWRLELWFSAANIENAEPLESPGFPYLSTDQVRFYRGREAEPARLEDVPNRIFSEAMRDVDLFVGVASVGNDPGWADGGPDGRHRNYWEIYAFGELNASAKTRKAVLAKLVPRLKIAKQCSITEKFLVVKGSLRTYKIHLGSGNIQMEPRNQYLCVVPDQRSFPAGQSENIFLPFEGDGTLAIILSKAFLLAEDEAIKDPSILSQIRIRR